MGEPNRLGQIIAERYRLDRKLGEGGMGEVWAALHLVTKKPVALKFLKGDARTDAAMSRRLLREARAASAVRHPNVVQVHDALQLPSGEVVIVMDLLTGESLWTFLTNKGVLSLGETASVLVPALRGLRAAHAAGIVHRDLKPDNVFIDRPSADEVQPKLLDFGIAKLTGSEGVPEQSMQLTQTGTLMGTPYYMSPEQVYGERDLDRRSDVWSMAVMAYECLCGKKPFLGDNFGPLFKAITRGDHVPLAQAAPHVPTEVAEVVEQMLRVDREERTQSVEALIEVLTPYCGQAIVLSPSGQVRIGSSSETDETVVASEVTPALPPKPQPRRTWVIAGSGMVALGLGVLWWTSQSADPSPSDETDPGAAAAGSMLTSATAVPLETTTPASGSPNVFPSAARVTAVADATAVPSVDPGTAPTANTRRAPTTRAKATSEPTAGDAPAEVTDPTPAVTRLPGSIVGDTPF